MNEEMCEKYLITLVAILWGLGEGMPQYGPMIWDAAPGAFFLVCAAGLPEQRPFPIHDGHAAYGAKDDDSADGLWARS
jgi:hypothetical protein